MQTRGGPLWSLGSRWFGVTSDGGVIAVRTNGSDELVWRDAAGTETVIDMPATASSPSRRSGRALISGWRRA
jgi:hypothetical protein